MSESAAYTVRDLLNSALDAGVDVDARFEAEMLLASVLDRNRAWLCAFAEQVVAADRAAAFHGAWQRRRAGEPLAYILGRREFWSLSLAVGPHTLIPRPETERLVELALARMPAASPRVLDLGTGSGAIALALAKERPDSCIVAVDASESALTIAAANARALALTNVEFRCGDWWGPVRNQRFDLVVGNPPYLSETDPHIDDLRFEPRLALVAGTEGLEAHRAIAAAARAHLASAAWLLLEHGQSQGAAVREILFAEGLCEVQTWQDLEGRDRVSGGRMD